MILGLNFLVRTLRSYCSGCSSNESDALLIHKCNDTLESVREIHAGIQSTKNSVDVNAKKARAIQGETRFQILKLKPETIDRGKPKWGDISSRSPGFQKAHAAACSPSKKYLEIDAVPSETKKTVNNLRGCSVQYLEFPDTQKPLGVHETRQHKLNSYPINVCSCFLHLRC